MTDAVTEMVTSALGDLDTAISGISGEMSTLVEQIQQLRQQILAGNTIDAATLVAEIEQRASVIAAATTAAQTALATASSPAGGGATNPPPVTEPSTPASTPVDNPPADTVTGGGSSMG